MVKAQRIACSNDGWYTMSFTARSDDFESPATCYIWRGQRHAIVSPDIRNWSAGFSVFGGWAKIPFNQIQCPTNRNAPLLNGKILPFRFGIAAGKLTCVFACLCLSYILKLTVLFSPVSHEVHFRTERNRFFKFAVHQRELIPGGSNER